MLHLLPCQRRAIRGLVLVAKQLPGQAACQISLKTIEALFLTIPISHARKVGTESDDQSLAAFNQLPTVPCGGLRSLT